MSIHDTIRAVIESKNQKIPKNIAFVLDTSISTFLPFTKTPDDKPIMTVLEKEVAIIRDYMLKHPDNIYTIVEFNMTAKSYPPIRVLKEENMVLLPDFTPAGKTYTHHGLNLVNSLVTEFDSVIIVTDGNTDSKDPELWNAAKDMKNLNIIAVSRSDADVHDASYAEEKMIPGMDIVDSLQNKIQKLTVYSRKYQDVPYEAATSSFIDKKHISFWGHEIHDSVPVFLRNLLTALEKNKDHHWGEQAVHFKHLVSEIGKLLTVLFVSFPEDHSFFKRMVTTLRGLCNIPEMTTERITRIIRYGFECTKSQSPIVYSGFEQHVKDRAKKQKEIKDAEERLLEQGTTLGSSKYISMPQKGLCAVVKNGAIPVSESLSTIPNSKDKMGNVYFGCEGASQQSIRLGMRAFCGENGFRNSHGSHNVIFYAASQMSLLWIKGYMLDLEYMRELQKIAVIQTSMENMLSKDTYSGVGLYAQWKAGKTVPMSYGTSLSHSSLYKDRNLNPLQLSEALWWALMMTMLGIFVEQKHCGIFEVSSKRVWPENSRGCAVHYTGRHTSLHFHNG